MRMMLRSRVERGGEDVSREERRAWEGRGEERHRREEACEAWRV